MANATTMPLRETREEPSPSARIYLQPIAAPSILGLYGFAGATFVVAAYMAHWYGSPATYLYLAPFVAIFGGLAQFTAAMWSFKARDGLATAVHGTWGAFWMAFGLLALELFNGPVVAASAVLPALGYWFIALAAITWVLMIAATAQNMSVAVVLGFLAAGSTLAAVGDLSGLGGWGIAAGYCLLVSAFAAWFAASVLLLKGIGRRRRPPAEPSAATGRMEPVLVSVGRGEPGVIKGQ